MSDRSFWDEVWEILGWVLLVAFWIGLFLLLFLGRRGAEPSVENSFPVVPWIPEE